MHLGNTFSSCRFFQRYQLTIQTYLQKPPLGLGSGRHPNKYNDDPIRLDIDSGLVSQIYQKHLHTKHCTHYNDRKSIDLNRTYEKSRADTSHLRLWNISSHEQNARNAVIAMVPGHG